jgi:hypothetical protein
MKTTSKKLFVSAFALLFALVAVATTSFAWFTISGKARVQEFELDITVGEGIQIQIENLTNSNHKSGWKNVITLEDLATYVSGFNDIVLDHLTSVNAQDFYQIVEGADQKYSVDDQTMIETGYLELKLNFRANQDYYIHLTEDAKVVSGVITHTPDWTTTPYNVDPANAVRVGFVYSNTVKIWEPINEDNLGGYGDPTESGGIAYFNAKMNALYPENIVEGEPYKYLEFDGTEQETFGGIPNEGINPNTSEQLVQLTAGNPGDGYGFEGSMIIRIWIEGWDADCFDGIFYRVLKTTLAFEGKIAQSTGGE